MSGFGQNMNDKKQEYKYMSLISSEYLFGCVKVGDLVEYIIIAENTIDNNSFLPLAHTKVKLVKPMHWGNVRHIWNNKKAIWDWLINNGYIGQFETYFDNFDNGVKKTPEDKTPEDKILEEKPHSKQEEYNPIYWRIVRNVSTWLNTNNYLEYVNTYFNTKNTECREQTALPKLENTQIQA
jgi:hypothetical protein